MNQYLKAIDNRGANAVIFFSRVGRGSGLRRLTLVALPL